MSRNMLDSGRLAYLALEGVCLVEDESIWLPHQSFPSAICALKKASLYDHKCQTLRNKWIMCSNVNSFFKSASLLSTQTCVLCVKTDQVKGFVNLWGEICYFNAFWLMNGWKRGRLKDYVRLYSSLKRLNCVYASIWSISCWLPCSNSFIVWWFTCNNWSLLGSMLSNKDEKWFSVSLSQKPITEG